MHDYCAKVCIGRGQGAWGSQTNTFTQDTAVCVQSENKSQHLLICYVSSVLKQRHFRTYLNPSYNILLNVAK